MLGIPLRYLLRHPLSVADLAGDPLQVLTNISDVYVAQREQRRPPCSYESDESWERRLHEYLGLAWPCQLTSEFWDIWPEVIKNWRQRGLRLARRASDLGTMVMRDWCGRSGAWFAI